MGITSISLARIHRHIKTTGKLLILGCQNLYDNEHYGEIAHPYFESLGFDVRSWDLLGCQGSETIDLRENLHLIPVYDFIYQHGTIEHIDGSLYQPLKNIHEASKVGYLMIHENPKKDNWPLHGQHYFTEDFYTALAKACDYEILELTSEASMSNYVDGWNVSVVLKKTTDNEFIDEQSFNEIYAKHIFSK